MNDSTTLKSIDKKLSALLALSALSISGGAQDAKLEVVLRGAGLEFSEISRLLGKNESAIRKAVERAKK